MGGSGQRPETWNKRRAAFAFVCFLADPHCESMQFMVEGRDFITL